MSIPIEIEGEVVGYRKNDGEIMSLHPKWSGQRARALEALTHLERLVKALEPSDIFGSRFNIDRNQAANMRDKVEARIVGLDLQDKLEKDDPRIKEAA